jgi:DNA (cytosine-5)-methyltransferase 1
MNGKYTYIDLFAGCGGLSLGLYHAGWKGLFAIEKSPDAFKTLKHNLIDSKAHFDWPDWLGEPTNHEIDKVLRKHKNDLLGLRNQVDMIVGGPPCQGFSSAGRRRENDQRNRLVNSYIKFIKLVKPKIIFFENVKGFTLEFKKNKEKGRQYSSYVEAALIRAGYRVKGQLINFGDYGIPQKRTRFILVGIREDFAEVNNDDAESFFKKINSNKESFLVNKKITVNTKLKDAISDLLKSHGTVTSPDSKDFAAGIYSKTSNPYQLLLRGSMHSGVVDSHRFTNHREDIVSKFRYILENGRKNKNVDKTIRKKYKIKKHTVIALAKNSKSPTITTLPDDYIHYKEPRILTVREYARIQSFPDWFEFKGKYTTGGKMRTLEVPRYTQIGNAIPPLFAEQSGLALKQLLG